MVTILLEQIIEILKGWLSSFTSWAEDTAEKLGLIEEATEYIDDIYDETTQIQTNTSSIADSNTRIQGYSLIISNKANTIDSNVTAIKNNVGSIAASSGAAAAFAEDCATNGLNILDKVTTIASDTTQLRADNTVVKSDLDKIYDALKWSLVAIDTTETEEGIGSVSFDTDKTDVLNQFDIAFEAVQTGTGIPSPDNVRPITGWSDFDITANGTPYNLDLSGTYYVGIVNTITGNITITHKLVTYNGSEVWSDFGTGNGYYRNISDMRSGTSLSGLSDWLPYFTDANTLGFRLGVNNNRIYIYQANTLTGVSDVNSWKTYLSNHNLSILYPLATPVTATATNTLTINTRNGINTITSDSNGKMTVTYTESVKHYLDKQEG